MFVAKGKGMPVLFTAAFPEPKSDVACGCGGSCLATNFALQLFCFALCSSLSSEGTHSFEEQGRRFSLTVYSLLFVRQSMKSEGRVDAQYRHVVW